MCSDAFMYIWTKRQFVGEMVRLIDGGASDAGAVVISHTHNERTWSPSHGQPLPPEGYRDLFETLEPRIFGEAGLFADVVQRRPARSLAARRRGDARQRSGADHHRQPQPGVFTAASAPARRRRRRRARINPLYASRSPMASGCALRLQFPSEDYEEEYGACRQYLPEEADARARRRSRSLQAGRLRGELTELVRRQGHRRPAEAVLLDGC